IIRGSVDDVWRAHHEPELLRRWQLGPDGWNMPVCEVSTEVGGRYRYEWAPIPGGPADNGENGGFGFVGEIIEISPPHREVATESMIGMEDAAARNEMTLTPVEGGTLLSLVITYPSREVRDTVLATGMTDGMEQSYARLERDVLVGA
ncbi:MAG: SRPBCC domain-containing protein, partial [Pseudoclavibacter sp.]